MYRDGSDAIGKGTRGVPSLFTVSHGLLLVIVAIAIAAIIIVSVFVIDFVIVVVMDIVVGSDIAHCLGSGSRRRRRRRVRYCIRRRGTRFHTCPEVLL